MTTKQAFFTLSCLLFLVIAGQPGIVRAQQHLDKEWNKSNHRAYWEGKVGIGFSAQQSMEDPGFRAALGVSDEHYGEILAKVYGGTAKDNLESLKAEREYKKAWRALQGGGSPYLDMVCNRRAGDEEAWNRLEKAGERKRELEQRKHDDRGSERRTVAFDDVLSPELKQKILEAALVAQSAESMSVATPSLLSAALNLTDAQKEGMERIKKELEPDFEKHLETHVDNYIMLKKREAAIFDSREPAGPDFATLNGDWNTWIEYRKETQREWIAKMKKVLEDPAYKKFYGEMEASSKAFVTLFRTRMLEILTDEQRKRLQALFDDPPPSAKYLIQRAKRPIEEYCDEFGIIM